MAWHQKMSDGKKAFLRKLFELNFFLITIYITIYFRLQKSLQTLPGDILMVSAFVSYIGYFTKVYRQELIQNSWLPFFKETKVSLLSIKINI